MENGFGEAEVYALIALALLIVGAAAVFPGFAPGYVLPFEWYHALTLIILGAYGITAFWKIWQAHKQGVSAKDLIPGLDDRYVVGFTSIGCMAWLAGNVVISIEFFIAFFLWVMAGLGLMYLSWRD